MGLGAASGPPDDAVLARARALVREEAARPASELDAGGDVVFDIVPDEALDQELRSLHALLVGQSGSVVAPPFADGAGGSVGDGGFGARS